MSEGVTEVPQQFRTSDGKKHPSKQEAETHQNLLDAHDEYESAKRRYGTLLAQSQRTADGRPFEFGVLRSYWRVKNVWGAGPPSVQRVEFGYDTKVDAYSDPVELVVMEGVQGHWSTYRRQTYRISELYADRTNAEEAALDLQIEWYRDRVEKYPALREAIRRLTEEAPHD